MRITYPDGSVTDEADCTESCPGSSPDPWTEHPGGKFGDCRTEALWGASLEWQPEETGSTDWHVWACILHFPVGEYLCVEDPALPADGDEIPGPADIWIPAGSYVLCGDDRGFVWIESSPADGRGAAQARFEAIDADYGAWCEQGYNTDEEN